MPDRPLAIQKAALDAGRIRPVMLAIAGDSAAGKTTLTKGIAEALGRERVASICVDDYHRYDREEGPEHSPSDTILLRPTIPHPKLAEMITDDVGEAVHLKLARDENGRPVDAIHIHGYAPAARTRPIEKAIWAALGVDEPLPAKLGVVDGERSESLALTQLILLYHVIRKRSRRPEVTAS